MKIPGGGISLFLLPFRSMPAPSRITPQLRGPVALSHLAAQTFVTPGNRAVDATCGNGNDTLLLAELVGQTGRVWAFDIQQEAIETTRGKLAAAGMLDRVELINGSHESMGDILREPVATVLFNLGYLPGGNRGLTTTTETTLVALDSALTLIIPGGIIAATLYPGHPEGAREHDAVAAWAAGLDPRRFHTWEMGQMNVAPSAPRLILIQKAATE